MDSRQVSAARMISLGLTEPHTSTPAEVATALGCIQAQALGGALASVALRTEDRSLAGVRAAFDSGEIVRTWTQRGTIHFAPARDVGWILSLTAERIMKSESKRRDFFGVDEQMIESAATIAETTIRERGPLTRTEILEAFAPVSEGSEEYGRQRYLLTTLSMRGIIIQGPLVPGKDEQLYVLSSDWIASPVSLDPEAALVEWLRRYVTSHGPVTIDDAARWTGLPKTPCRHAISALIDSGAIESTTIDDREYFQAPGLEDLLAAHEDDAQGVFLLPGFDELILGYKDRSFTLDPVHEKAVVPGSNGMFKNTAIKGTRARATWKKSTLKSGPRVLLEPLAGQRINARDVEKSARRHPSFA